MADRPDSPAVPSSELFRLVVEAAPNAIVMADEQGCITLVNAQAERLFGYSRDELIGRAVETLVPQRIRKQHPKQRASYLASPQTRPMGAGRDLHGVTKEGREVPIEIGLNPIQTPQGTFVLASIIDITERKRAESALKSLNESLVRQIHETTTAMEELRRTQAQLVQSEKMASLGGLVAGVAHEINTPVGVAVTAASTLRARSERLLRKLDAEGLAEADVRAFASVIGESTQILMHNLQRAAELVRSFKQVAVDQSSGERRRFDLRSYVDEILQSLAPQLKKCPHPVDVECPEVISVDTYPGALAQILANFVANSLIHAFPDGRAGRLRIRITQQHEHIVLSYSDDGIGIAPEDLSRIYDPFFTTKRGAGGSGLGLNIVYNLATNVLGGSIEVASAHGRGTEFTIRFPAFLKQPPHTDATISRPPPATEWKSRGRP